MKEKEKRKTPRTSGVVCCPYCKSEDIERVTIGNTIFPKCKSCGEMIR